MERITEKGTMGCWQGHNGPDNQPTKCLSFIPTGVVGGDGALKLGDASGVDMELAL